MSARPAVLILYTGGTIGMERSHDGYTASAGLLQQKLNKMPVFQDPRMPTFELLEYNPLLDSSNMQPEHWQQIASDIVKHYDNYNGFVVLHGTDTMAYTASALSFMLEHLNKPVILTGAQVPLSELHSDGRNNLLAAMYYAGHYNIPEVCLCFNNELYRGNRSRKIHASQFNAFASPNYPNLGHVGIDFDIYSQHLLTPTDAALTLHPIQTVEIATIRLFPGLSAKVLESILQIPLQGLVLECYGSGNAPNHDKALLAAIKKAHDANILILNITQCLQGHVNMNGYATGHALQALGVISGQDMTPEAAITKLHHVLSLNLSCQQQRYLLESNLRGELTPLTKELP